VTRRKIRRVFGIVVAVFPCAVATAETHNVTVGNNFFQPSSLTVNVGDTVQWSNSTGVGHNVVSCNPLQSGCNGETANETFGSGAPSGFWFYSYTFTAAGSNPYVCQPHAPGMAGVITVVSGPLTPPPVPDGTTGDPMRVGKLAPDGSALTVTWDAMACPGAEGHHLVYGLGSQLPASPGGIYDLRGAECDLGTSSPFSWNNVPAVADADPLLWWFLLADDGALTEGSWGTDGTGDERTGPGAGGSSGQCGITQKDLANECSP
jgi:plastocyanin